MQTRVESAGRSAGDDETAGTVARWDILIVEDDRVICDQLAERFRDEGYLVTTAANGAVAIDIVKSAEVGVVILDLMLPVVSGWDFMKAVENLPELARVPPTLIITAFSNARRPSTSPVFLKPLNLQSLVRAVHAYLGPRQ